MDQQKVGKFLRELRFQKELTQEQLAEKFNTSNRSVSRWENGRCLPDISVLVELADFYDVEVREMIDGERKSEEMKEEVKDVVLKMVDYAEGEKGRLLVWVRRVAVLGVIAMAVVIALQTFQYESGVGSFVCYLLSILAFVVMAVLALHTNGMLEKLAKRKYFIAGCKISVIVAIILVIIFILRFLLVFVIAFVIEIMPGKHISGISNYDKEFYTETYVGDMDSELFVFPDDTSGMIDPTFESDMDTGFFDTDGYIILHARYSEEDYSDEVERLSGITCTLYHERYTVTKKIKYDEENYQMPAYVAVDGFDYSYEYALLNDAENSITYIYLSYPNYITVGRYKKYLKKDVSEYDIHNVLNRFSIYVDSLEPIE